MKQEIVITKEEHGKRIDVVAHHRFPKISRSRWMKYGLFLEDKHEKKAKTKAKEGQCWKISCPTENTISETITPWDYSLKVLAESKTWVVIEKPIGIAVHPSISGPAQRTIVNALVHHFGNDLSESFDEIEGRKIPRPGLVHRLDKTTSGILLVAKTNATHRYFQDHWSECEKFYQAVVEGKTPKKGKIEGAIYRDPYDRKKMTVSSDLRAKSATTLFETVESESGLSHLKVQILTGRTHQIRVHLSSIGFPILGDMLYGGSEADRIFLHASTLKFPDPDNEGEIKTVVSALPKSFEKAKLRR